MALPCNFPGGLGVGRLLTAQPSLGRLTGKVELQELRQDLVVGEIGGPAVGGEHGLVEPAMGVGEPRRPLVVEVGQGPLGELLRAVGVEGLEAGPQIGRAERGLVPLARGARIPFDRPARLPIHRTQPP